MNVYIIMLYFQKYKVNAHEAWKGIKQYVNGRKG